MATALRPESQPHDEIAVAGGCALCHGSRHKTFLIAKQRTVIECAECDLRALSPMPSLDKMVSVNEETVHPFFNACLEDEGSYRTYFSPKLDDLQRYQPAGRLLDVGCGAAASTPLSS